MRCGGIILARMDSRRVPGKALLNIAGRPLLSWLLLRARRCVGIDGNLVLATTDRPVDDSLASFAEQQGLGLFRGDACDVAGRVLAAARQFDLDAFVRLNGDSPLLPIVEMDRGIAQLKAENLDLVTNLRPRRFPYGVSIEIVRTTVLAATWPEMTASDCEHVTQALYHRLDRLRWANLTHDGPDLAHRRLTIDEPADIDAFDQCLSDFGAVWDRIDWRQAADHPAFVAKARQLPAQAETGCG